jgi:hypothetical protein
MKDDVEHRVIYMTNVQLQPFVRKIYSLMRPMDVRHRDLVRMGRDFDGGYIMLDYGLNNAIAYSLGINDDVSWDLGMAELGCDVFQYDHTIEQFPADHPKFHSFKIGICDRPSQDPVFKTIEELVLENGHEAANGLILKMDIEGAEWSVLEHLSSSTINQFSQILMEVHWFKHVDETAHVRRFIEVLSKMNQTHQIIHVHSNNSGPIVLVAGMTLPDTFELTYVRKTDHEFSECRKIFPTPMDMPCDIRFSDYFLGALGLL